MGNNSYDDTYGVKDFVPRLAFHLGWIVYNDENKSLMPNWSHWESVRVNLQAQGQHAYQNFCNITTQANREYRLQQLASELYVKASAERQKEYQLLEQFGFDHNVASEIDFIKRFNELIIGREVFLRNLDKVNAAINASEASKDSKDRAPSNLVNFFSYLESALNAQIDKESTNLNSVLFNPDNDDLWDGFFTDAIDTAIYNTFNIKTQTVNTPLTGTADAYQDLLQFFQDNPLFYSYIKSYFPFDTLKQQLIDEIKNEKKQKKALSATKKSNLKKIVRGGKNIKIDGKGNSKAVPFISEQTARTVGGLLQEILMQGRITLKVNENGAKVVGGAINSNVGATDSVTLLSYDQTLNLSGIYDVLESAFKGRSQLDIMKNLNNVAKQLKKAKFEDLFIIHTSDKLYSMASTFNGFEKKSNHINNISQLVKVINAGENLSMDTNEIVSIYLNTRKGAIFESKQTELQEKFKDLFTAYVADMLFSDWKTVGNIGSGAQHIHVFDLDDILVPYSYLLIAMADTISQMDLEALENYVTMNRFSSTGSILYPATITENRYGLTGENQFRFIEKWKEERASAQSAATFGIHFTKNFKSIIKEMTNNLKR